MRVPRDRQYSEADLAQYTWKATGFRFVRGAKHDAFTNSALSTLSVPPTHAISAGEEQQASVTTKRAEWWSTLAIHERKKEGTEVAVFEPAYCLWP